MPVAAITKSRSGSGSQKRNLDSSREPTEKPRKGDTHETEKLQRDMMDLQQKLTELTRVNE